MLKIRKYEWEVLKQNLVNAGNSWAEAGDIIKEKKKIMEEHYDYLRSKLKEGKITPEKMMHQFKQKFWDMCQELQK